MRYKSFEGGECCCLCGKTRNIEHHHVFGGPFRAKSEKYHCVIPLCHEHHNEPPGGVHFNRALADRLKAETQAKLMQEQGWSTADFIREFGKNYLPNVGGKN